MLLQQPYALVDLVLQLLLHVRLWVLIGIVDLEIADVLVEVDLWLCLVLQELPSVRAALAGYFCRRPPHCVE